MIFVFVLFFDSVRVQCADNYYNTTCTTFCRPRNDQFGHYTCGEQGNKVCLPGWQGANCEKGTEQQSPLLFFFLTDVTFLKDGDRLARSRPNEPSESVSSEIGSQ